MLCSLPSIRSRILEIGKAMMKKAAIKKYTKLEKERRKEEKRIGERDRERPKRVNRKR